MRKSFTCLHGHSWEVDFGEQAATTVDAVTCPECGAAAETLPRETAVAQTPPPLPSTVATALTSAKAGLGEPLAGYEILEELGRGGMGVVYKAWQKGLKRVVALKMILAGGYAGAEALARFRLEAEAVARLQHPNIIQIYDFGEWRTGEANPPMPFFSLEYLDGGSLAQRLRGAPLPVRPAAELVETLARAIHYAHERGIIHRDLKPANILLMFSGRPPGGADDMPPRGQPLNDGVPKITDFGLAKQIDTEVGRTQTGAVLGTPSYMAPEQAAGDVRRVGPASDIYALGAIFYETLTGRPPFRGATTFETLEQVLGREPVPPSRLQPKTPSDLETICLKCLEKAPARRYPSAAELADDLRRFLNGRPIQARPVPAWEQAIKWAKRRPAAAALVIVSAAALLSLSGGAIWHDAQMRNERDHARAEEHQAKRNLEHARVAADTLVSELADGIRPIAGTQSKTVEKILQSAARVYEDLLAEGATMEVLEGQGRMLNSFADVYLEMNDSRRALASAREALALFTDLTRREPDNARFHAGLARSHEKVSRVLHEQGHPGDALAALRRSLALREEWSAREPEDADWQLDLAASYNGLVNIYWELEDIPGQRSANQKHLELRRRLADQALEDQRRRRELATALEKAGDALYEDNKLKEARVEFGQAVHIYQDLLAQDPSNTDWSRDLARILQSVGMTYYWEGNNDRAAASFRTAQDIAERFARQDPSNVQWQRLVLGCRLKSTLTKPPNDPAATREKLAIVEAMYAIAEPRARQDPDRLRWQYELAVLKLQTGMAHAAQAQRGEDAPRNLARAETAIKDAANMLESLTQREPAAPTYAQTRADVHEAAGAMLDAQKKPADAQQSYLRAAQQRLAAAERFGTLYADNPKWPTQRARSQRQVGFCLLQLVQLKAAPQEQLDEALRSSRAAVAGYESLLRQNSADAALLGELAEAHETQSAVYQALGNPSEAAAATKKAQEIKGRAGQQK